MIMWFNFNAIEPKDHEFIIFYSASKKKVYCAEYMDEGYVRVIGKEWLPTEYVTLDINYSKDLWMSLPSTPGKRRKTRSDKIVGRAINGCLLGKPYKARLCTAMIPLTKKRKKKNEMD